MKKSDSKKYYLIIDFIVMALFFTTPFTLFAGGWVKIWGPTEFVVVDGESGDIYAKPGPGSSLPPDIYFREPSTNVWTALGMPQLIKCVTSGWKPKNTLYCLTNEGVVYRYKGIPNSWESLGGPSNGKAGDIFGGPDQLLATATGSSPDIFLWDIYKNSWVKIGGPSKTFIVGRSPDPEFKQQVYGQSPDNVPSETNGIYQWSGIWNKRGGPAGSIYISMSTLFATNPQSGDILSLYPTGWKRIGGPGNMFATDHKGNIFGLSPDKKGVYRWTGTPNQWEKIGGTADKIYAGWDRLLFAINPETKDLWFYRGECPQITNLPNFASTIITEKMRPVLGSKFVMAILWDPHRPDHPAPTKRENIEEMLFGGLNSASNWFYQNSGGKVVLVNAGTLGWYDAPLEKQGEHYWDEHGHQYGNYNDGWTSGHNEKWADAIKRAANDVNFKIYDMNNDGKVTPDELAILIIIPQVKPFGKACLPVVGKQTPFEPLMVQGVQITEITEWYSGIPVSFGTALHELAHQIIGTPDMYFKGHWPYAAGVYSNSDNSVSPVHISAFEKLKLGWLNYKVVSQNGIYPLNAVESSNEALILYNPKRGLDEYFIIENRWRGTSYDASSSGYAGLPMDGIAIWHIIENPAVFNQTIPWPPTGVKDEWGRLSIRLIRANGGTPFDNTKALFNKKGTIVSDFTHPAQLLWLDGTRSGFEVKLLSDAGPQIQMEVNVYCP